MGKFLFGQWCFSVCLTALQIVLDAEAGMVLYYPKPDAGKALGDISLAGSVICEVLAQPPPPSISHAPRFLTNLTSSLSTHQPESFFSKPLILKKRISGLWCCIVIHVFIAHRLRQLRWCSKNSELALYLVHWSLPSLFSNT